MKRVKIIFLRHAETEMNRKRIIQGWTDSPLTQESMEKLKLKSENFREFKFKSAYSSDLDRANTTCRLLLNHIDLENIEIIKTELFREFNYGYFENKSESYLVDEATRWMRKNLSLIDKFKLKFLRNKYFKTKIITNTVSMLDKHYNKNSINPVLDYIDSHDDVLERIKKMKELLRNHPDETILIVSHGHFLNFLLHVLFHDQDCVPSRIPNLSGFQMDYLIDEEIFINLSYIN